MALVFMDPALLPDSSVDTLVESTKSKSPGVRFQSYSVLAILGPRAVNALPVLIKGAADPHNVPRWAAIRALGSVGRDTVLAKPEILETLIKATADADLPVQQIAALSLGKNLGSPVLPGVLPGEDNAAAKAALTKMLESKQPYIVQTAAWALIRMYPSMRGTLPAELLEKLHEVTSALDQMAAQ